MESALTPLTEHLTCDQCRHVLAERIKTLVIQWSFVKVGRSHFVIYLVTETYTADHINTQPRICIIVIMLSSDPVFQQCCPTFMPVSHFVQTLNIVFNSILLRSNPVSPAAAFFLTHLVFYQHTCLLSCSTSEFIISAYMS